MSVCTYICIHAFASRAEASAAKCGQVRNRVRAKRQRRVYRYYIYICCLYTFVNICITYAYINIRIAHTIVTYCTHYTYNCLRSYALHVQLYVLHIQLFALIRITHTIVTYCTYDTYTCLRSRALAGSAFTGESGTLVHNTGLG